MRRQKKPAPNLERAEPEQQIESLRPDIRKLELERDILEKANELVKKDGHRPQLLSNREKTTLVDALKQNLSVARAVTRPEAGPQFLLLLPHTSACR